MAKLVTLTSLALLLTAGFASAQNPTTPSAALTPDQCNQVWSTAVTQGETPSQAAAPNIGSFAQVDDFAQIDTNNDGAIDQKEFTAACGKGLIHEADSQMLQLALPKH
jgi:hypothetical protein